MKRIFLTLLVITSLFHPANAQNSDPGKPMYRNFPLVVGLQFQNIGLPFKNFKDVFANPGIRIGTEVSLTGRQKQNWAQGFNFGWNHNKNAGNNIALFTQTIYRPTIIGNINTDIKLGIGMMRSLHPTDSFKQIDGGQWVNEGTAGKTMLMFPAGISVGYNGYHSGSYVSPFISYELMAATQYDRSVLVLPVSTFLIGTRIYLIDLKERK